MAFHGSDVSISVVIPREWSWSVDTMMTQVCRSAIRLCESYGVQAEALMRAPQHGRIAYCLTETNPYAVLVNGRKIAGVALRRFPESWLIQGSVLIQPLPARLSGVLPHPVRDALNRRAVALASVTSGQAVMEREVAQRWAEQWPTWWEQMISPIWKDDFTDAIDEVSAGLAQGDDIAQSAKSGCEKSAESV